jgi:phosphodiesterase/alkaline phosphatase D-like protein
VLTLPQIPVANSATSRTSTGFTANWGGAAGATSYRLDVATDGFFASLVPGYDNLNVGNTISYAVTGLAPGTTYYYRVRAVNTAGTSGNSNAITVSTLPAIPNAPTATAASAITTGGFTANWNAVAGATGYRLDVASDSAFTSIVTGYNDLDVGNTTTYPVTGRSPGTTYYYRVRAVSVEGTSANSNVIKVSTIPVAPNAASATAITTGGFTANWNAVAGATGYRLDLATDATFSSMVTGYNNLDVGNSITCAVTGQNPGTTYYYQVRAVNGGGTSANSNVITVSTLPASPNIPVATTATAITTSGFTANWNTVTGATGYRLDVATDVGFTSILGGYNNLDVGNSTAYPVTGLNQGTTYYYQVRAVSGAGTSASSNVITVSTLPAPPNAPTATAASAITTTGFTANWNGVAGATGYRLDVATDGAFGSIVAGYNDLTLTDTTSCQVAGLNPGTTYYYRVRAVNGGGTSTNSNVITVTTLPASPNTPTATTATAITASGFTANWNSVAGATGYRLDVATDIGFGSIVGGYNNLDAGNAVSYVVTGLNPGTTYYYRVRAVSGGGTSASSNVMTVSTLPAAPNAPTATIASSLTTSGFTANWSPVSGVTGYRLDVALEAGFVNFVSPYNDYDVGNSTGYSVTGLQEGTTYYYRVRAVGGGGSSGNSNSISVTTLISYPSTYSLSWSVPFASNASLKDFGSPDYRLVGLPGNSGRMISQFLNGQQDSQWEVYWDNGTQTSYPGYYVKYNGGADFQCATGKAFWVLQIGDWTRSSETVNTTSLDANREVAIPLTRGNGYYLITNPFTRRIPWSAVESLNGLTGSPIRAWTSTGWENAVDFVPYEGYLFFNGSGQTAIRIPFDQTVAKAGPAMFVDANSWRVDVVVRCGRFVDQTTSFGVSGIASIGLDPYEQRKPRHFAAVPDVYFDRPAWDANFAEFATDFRPGVVEVESWEMHVRSEEKKLVELEFKGVDRIPPELEVYLIDKAGGRGVDLRKQAKYALKPTTKVTALSVVVGKAERVKALVNEALPTEYALLQNYPNPFNPTTTIPISVPEQGRVALEIYNILGQRIRTVYEGTLATGRYTFEWDGKNDQAQQSSTGLYICTLHAGKDVRMSRRITLVR